MTTVKFGSLTFPVNPQSLTRTYRRQLARKNLLGTGQALESKQRSLINVSLNGVLTGTNAKTIMDSLESYFEGHQVETLITPTYTGGENAIITELDFEVELIKLYQELIRFNINFLLTSGVSVPAWTLQVQDSGGVFQNVVGLIDFNIEQQFGGVAAAFEFTADNRNGQNAYPIFDYGRQVKIEIGYAGAKTRRMWGIIDTLDYGITKGSGSTLRVAGRDFSARLLEGFIIDKTYNDWYPDGSGSTGTNIIADLLSSTGVGVARLGSVDWSNWNTGNPWPIYLVFRNETRLEAIKKLSDIYKMEFWMDADDLSYGIPQLVWRQQTKVSSLQADVSAGQNYIIVNNINLWKSGNIYVADVNSNEMKTISSIDSANSKIYFTSNLVHDYTMAAGGLVTNFADRFPTAKVWGEDVISIQIRRTGIPLRNRVEVYGDGIYSIADTDVATLSPSGLVNPGYDPTNSTKYRERRYIIEDKSIVSQTTADVTAYTQLLQLKDPDQEVRLRIIGDKDLTPGQYILFDDDDITGLAGTYRLVSIIHGMRSDGFTSELVLRDLLQSSSIKLLSDVIKDQAKYASGSQSLKNMRTQYPVIGTVTSVT